MPRLESEPKRPVIKRGVKDGLTPKQRERLNALYTACAPVKPKVIAKLPPMLPLSEDQLREYLNLKLHSFSISPNGIIQPTSSRLEYLFESLERIESSRKQQ